MTAAPRYWRFAIPTVAICWILFKIGYPYPDFFTDSYTYIRAAAEQDAVSYRPIGYSLFLRLIHSISHSDDLLVTVQFLLVQASCWGLFRVVRSRCAPGPWAERMIMVFLALDPLVYYISNFVSSDALFIALTLFWLTALLRLTYAPRWRGVIFQAVVLLLAAETRYMALSYPLVAVICLARLRRRPAFRLAAIGITLGTSAAFVIVTREQVRAETGAPVFSAFGGWQIADNGLRVYLHLPVDTSGLPSTATKDLAGYATRYFEEYARGKPGDAAASTDFMWQRNSPLLRFLDDYRRRGSSLRAGADTGQLDYFDGWNRVAPVFSQYGYFIVRRHPVAFARYYLLPSAGSFFLPPLEVLALYNGGKRELDPEAKNWFGYRNNRPSVCSVTLQGKVCWIFPWLSLFLYIAGCVIAGLFAARRQLQTSHPAFSGFLVVVSIYLVLNACFNIFAAFSVYRYQVVPLILLFIFSVCGLFFVTCRKPTDHA